ncbi:unnamed protein product [Amoebophrya sp. A25]|nr:unnamed protein product [Amoebophrya sp. A25]|eukprot:GSA25T00009815001.1
MIAESGGPGTLYKVRVYAHGLWRDDVIVDDRVPVPPQLAADKSECKCVHRGEYQSLTILLLIKALAKVVGEYSMTAFVGWSKKAVYWGWNPMQSQASRPKACFLSETRRET